MRLLTSDQVGEEENNRAIGRGERRPPEYKISGYPVPKLKPDLPWPLLEARYLAEEHGRMAALMMHDRRWWLAAPDLAYRYAVKAAHFGREIVECGQTPTQKQRS